MEAQVDYHCHHTGSLSHTYFLQKKKISIKSIQLTDKKRKNNYKYFFRVYKRRQKLCETNSKINLFSDAIDIGTSYFLEGTKQFHLRIGFKLDIKGTKKRLEEINRGFDFVENKYGLNNFAKIVLTFIRGKNGKFINYSSRVINYILKNIYDQRPLVNRVIGFDISGPENNNDWKKSLFILKKINKFNLLLKSQNNTTMETMVHIGELVDIKSFDKTCDQIQDYLNLNINRISHGTILWISAKEINPVAIKKISLKQQKILTMMAEKGTILEICPSANYFLSPLKSIDQIPLNRLERLGIKYVIGTDNKGIFNTNLNKEHSLIKLNIKK